MPFYCATLLFIFYSFYTPLYATKCPDLTVDSLVNEIMYESTFQPDEDDSPLWHLLNEGDIRMLSDIVTSDDFSIKKLDNAAIFKNDHQAGSNIPDAYDESIRVYCRYEAKGSKVIDDKTRHLVLPFILFSELIYISKKERESLEKLPDIDILPHMKVPERSLINPPFFMIANPRLMPAYRLGLLAPFLMMGLHIRRPENNATPVKAENLGEDLD